MKEIKIKATYVSQYKKNGKSVFVYHVKGTDEQMARYKEAQGDYHKSDEETGNSLFFSTVALGQNIEVIVTRNNRVIADTTELDQAASMAARYGGNLGQAFADQAAAKFLGKLSMRPSVNTTASEDENVAENTNANANVDQTRDKIDA